MDSLTLRVDVGSVCLRLVRDSRSRAQADAIGVSAMMPVSVSLCDSRWLGVGLILPPRLIGSGTVHHSFILRAVVDEAPERGGVSPPVL